MFLAPPLGIPAQTVGICSSSPSTGVFVLIPQTFHLVYFFRSMADNCSQALVFFVSCHVFNKGTPGRLWMGLGSYRLSVFQICSPGPRLSPGVNLYPWCPIVDVHCDLFGVFQAFPATSAMAILLFDHLNLGPHNLKGIS